MTIHLTWKSIKRYPEKYVLNMKTLQVIKAEKTATPGVLAIEVADSWYDGEESATKPEEIIGEILHPTSEYERLAKLVIHVVGIANKLDCVKKIKEVTGLGLKESKDLFESLIAKGDAIKNRTA